MELSDRVRLKRKELGLTQEELAIRMGYKSRVSINKIEMGRPITQKIIIKLAKALNTTPAYLMGWEEKPKTQKELVQYFDDTIDTATLRSEVFRIEVGERIRNIRKNKNMSMKTLGEKVNLHEATVSKYETGDIQLFDIGKIKEFADALDVSPAYLMGLEETNENKLNINLLKAVREKNNITAYEIANEIGISLQDLLDYENGTKPITYEIIKKYADCLNIDVSLLYGIETEPNSSITRILSITKRWNEEVGIVIFTDEEMDELINFAKYLISKRKDGEKS